MERNAMENSITPSTLYLVATPIGNLEDITLRGLRILKEVDIIAAEDTRHSIKLLNHFEIKTKMVSYHQHNEKEGSEKLRALLQEGKSIALISDAGMPIISDPGFQLVRDCQEDGLNVEVVPGANAALCGVVLSGVDCRHFTFWGFIGKQSKDIKSAIEVLKHTPNPVVFYESPHRLLKILTQMAMVIPQREMSISREITKRYQETKRGTVEGLLAWFQVHPPKGEFVLVVDGGGDAVQNDEKESLIVGEMQVHLDYYIQGGMGEKEAMKQVAKDRGIGKREVYQELKV